MEERPLWQRVRTRPRISDTAKAYERLRELKAAMDATFASAEPLRRPFVRDLLAGLADHAPYLWELVAADPARLQRLLLATPEASLSACLAACDPGAEASEAEVMRRLRLAKQEIALLVALADLGGVWRFDEVVRSLSTAADRFIRVALCHLLRAAAAAGRLRLPDPGQPEEGCGLIVLGLGKLGGFDLNYSSDVDLMVIFDPDGSAIVDPDRSKTLYVRLVQDLVRLLQQPTAQGYVLRVDLRLRPDPGSTAVAISRDAALRYYETFGQNWERAALIKARPVAGDTTLGESFLQDLAPFIWRKYFDYAAIADVHAMKRQIHAVRGHAQVAVLGHNVKLGRGGIREIEFFVQTQQLIFGGKRPDLRGRRTLGMLRQLRRDGWIGAHAVADLARAYVFLRRTEHRLQMMRDEQTHSLPPTEDALERFARFCGFSSAARFAASLTRHLQAVVHHYALLFESAPGLDDTEGSLVFTGVTDDPETIATLRALGFKAPEVVAQTVREWHAGRRAGVQSPRARETLTELVPKLLATFSRVADPDAAVAAFDRALERMPAAGELFAILSANSALRTLFGDILGSAPRLAAAAVLQPHLLDGAIDPDRRISCDPEEMTRRAAAATSRARSIEDVLDSIRDFQHEEHFLIGVALLSGNIDAEDVGTAYSALATAVIRVTMDRVKVMFEEDHGRVSGGALCVLAMGKLGSREMTATSDLDLVLLYAYDETCPESDGPRPLPAPRYFTRLTQRFIGHLTAATRRGALYDVDMRLRPSGRQGPLATKLSAFVSYQTNEAATWERMALTRASVIAGDAAFCERVEGEIIALQRRPASPSLMADIAAMRDLIAREKPPANAWDLKLVPGGLVDIEFIAQGLVLAHASRLAAIVTPVTADVLRRAAELGIMKQARVETLLDAHRLMTRITQIMRLALDEGEPLDSASEAVTSWIARAAGLPDFAHLVAETTVARQAVREIFRGVVRSG